jgi:hypothetical protein
MLDESTASCQRPSASRCQMVAYLVVTWRPAGMRTTTVPSAYPRLPELVTSSRLMVRTARAAWACSMAWRQNRSIAARPRNQLGVLGEQPGILSVVRGHAGGVAGIEQRLEVAGELLNRLLVQ